jgi:hypothetical protein
MEHALEHTSWVPLRSISTGSNENKFGCSCPTISRHFKQWRDAMSFIKYSNFGMRLLFGIKALEGNMSLNKRKQTNAGIHACVGITILLASFLYNFNIQTHQFFP